jgi:hypothetical protein
MHYDPDSAPDPQAWLGLDKQERLRLAKDGGVSQAGARMDNGFRQRHADAGG